MVMLCNKDGLWIHYWNVSSGIFFSEEPNREFRQKCYKHVNDIKAYILVLLNKSFYKVPQSFVGANRRYFHTFIHFEVTSSQWTSSCDARDLWVKPSSN